MACFAPWGVSAIKKWPVLPPGAFQPLNMACFASWGVSEKRHFCHLGRFSYQETACLAPGAFQPSQNSIFGSWGLSTIKKHQSWAVSAIQKQQFWPLGRFRNQKTAFCALGAFQLPKNAHLRTEASLKGIRPAFRLHSVSKLILTTQREPARLTCVGKLRFD